MPTVTGKTTQITLRLDHDLAKRLDALARKFSRPGLEINRTDVARLALTEGLVRLEAERRKAPRRWVTTKASC